MISQRNLINYIQNIQINLTEEDRALKKALAILLAAVLCLAACFWILIQTNENFAVWLGLSSGPGKPVEIRSGTYFLKSELAKNMTPYLYLNLETDSARLSGSIAMSYAETGSFTVKDNRIQVETELTTYEFRIQDENTLILTDCTGENPFRLPVDGELVYSEEWN